MKTENFAVGVLGLILIITALGMAWGSEYAGKELVVRCIAVLASAFFLSFLVKSTIKEIISHYYVQRLTYWLNIRRWHKGEH